MASQQSHNNCVALRTGVQERRGNGHSAGRRERVRRRAHLSGLRLAARQSDRARQGLPAGVRQDAARAPRVPHPRRQGALMPCALVRHTYENIITCLSTSLSLQ